MTDYAQITVEMLESATVVRFRNSKVIDELVVRQVGDELLSLVADDGPSSLILNFSDVELFSSAALGHLIKLDRKTKAANVKLVLCEISDSIGEVFSLTKLDQVFQIASNQAEAIHSVLN